MKTYLGRGLLAALVCTTLVIAGPEWREDEDGGEDAGNVPGTAQTTTGEGGIGGISGRLGSLGGLPLAGGLNDFDDVYIICIDDPANFRATTADSGGFSEFDSRLCLFSLDGFGIVANNTTPLPPLSVGGGGPSPDGAVLENAANDDTGAQVLTSGLYLLAITVAPRTPLGGNGEPIFTFADPDEISGPDGPDGGVPFTQWNTAFGGCCIGGACSLLTVDDCANADGEYQGDGVVCTGVECPEADNNLCANAFAVDLGDTPFDTTQATTDGTPDCKGLDVLNDVWFTYTAPSAGLLDLNVCDSDFDAILFVYEGCTCPLSPGDLISCGLDCATDLLVDAGQCYTIRVGGSPFGLGYVGDGGGGGDNGTGTLSLSLTPVGACEFGKYECFITTEENCDAQEGYYLGDGTECPSEATGDANAGDTGPGTPAGPGAPGAGQVPIALHPGGVPVAASVGGDTPEPDGEYTIILQGVCFANEVPTGGCIFPDGSCDVTTEFDCVENAGGTWLGEDVPCPDVTPPTVICTATPGRGNAIVIGYSAEDESGPVTVTAEIDAGCIVVPVPSGQLVRLPWCVGNGGGGGGGNNATAPTGVTTLRTPSVWAPQGGTGTSPVAGGGPPCVTQAGSALLFHSTDVTLIVTAVDAAGNESTCTIDLCAEVGGG